MNISNNQRRTWLLILIAINTFATIIQFNDSIIFFDEYLAPSWINIRLIELFWFIMTPFGIAGYLQYVKGAFFSSYLCLYAYSAMSLSTLGHWLIVPPWEMSLKILFDVIVAITLIGFVVWSQVFVFVKEGRETTS